MLVAYRGKHCPICRTYLKSLDGATILGAHAGELAHLWVVAIEQKLNLRSIAQMMALSHLG